MEAIILAGGFGTRLRSVIKDVPKPMADIQGMPFLSYILDFLASQGVLHVLLSVGYKHEVIENFFGARYGNMDIRYVVESKPLGTGGAIAAALKHTSNDEVIVLNGDTFFGVDLRSMIDQHRQKNADLSLAVKRMENAERYGSVLVGPDGSITGFREKGNPGAGYINGGVYVIGRRVPGMLEALGETFSFEQDFLQQQVLRMEVCAFVSEAFFIDIGIPLDYKKAQDALARAVKERLA